MPQSMQNNNNQAEKMRLIEFDIGKVRKLERGGGRIFKRVDDYKVRKLSTSKISSKICSSFCSRTPKARLLQQKWYQQPYVKKNPENTLSNLR